MSAVLHSAMAAHKHLLTASNKKASIRFAIGRASWTAVDSDRVVFLDESMFSTR
ncbi:hypothetical protein HPB47_008437 [Ixodes persulcatus]|uniref:Uncharacterized protein n=1 Tax=Ixodes persulcatus TaxID=34615 RepID=A0AC60P4Q7_IXOPE|nr:hypothetical protein HPB47_008437 [Ixodes persulcatus]